MQYNSTRNNNIKVSSALAIKQGLSEEGGLFVPETFPKVELAEIADKFTRNEIMTSNEIRQVIRMKPSSDPKADMLINSNLNQPAAVTNKSQPNDVAEEINEEGENQNG